LYFKPPRFEKDFSNYWINESLVKYRPYPNEEIIRLTKIPNKTMLILTIKDKRGNYKNVIFEE